MTIRRAGKRAGAPAPLRRLRNMEATAPTRRGERTGGGKAPSVATAAAAAAAGATARRRSLPRRRSAAWRASFWGSLFLLLTCVGRSLCLSGPGSGATGAQKIAQLSALEKHGLVELDNESYETYIGAPRPYGLVLLLTAMSREHACVPCHELDPEYRLLASSWKKQKKDDRLVFGVIEFKRGMDVYRKLNLTSAPTVFYYPPLEGPKSGSVGVKYELHRRGLRAEALADWLSEQIDQKIRVIRPVDWSRYALMLGGLLLAGVVGKLLLTNFGHLLRLTGLWGAGVLVMILMMCSGHMWNHIRKPPYVVAGHDGRLEWIAGGFQQQFVLESQVFAMLQAIAAFCVVTLALRVPQLKDQKAVIALALGTVAVLMIDVSVMLWLFRIKNGGYPFMLFF